jgi:cytochrome c-type biogenesis protein CcmE
VPSKRSPARLVVALSVAAALAIFLLYTSIAGGTTPSLKPSQLAGHDGNVALGGTVLGPITGDSHAQGLRFRLRDPDGSATVPVLFHGSKPDLFAKGREVVASGRLKGDVFVATSLSTKCPSKYQPKRGS